LDCPQGGCDQDFFRTEMSYINWVRDRQDAQVHVLVTLQRTGAGGSLYTLEFIGLGRFDGSIQTLQHTRSPDATQDETREGMGRMIGLGLAPFAASTPAGAALMVRYTAPSEGSAGAAEPEDDPWNFWVFNLGARGFFNGQSKSKTENLSGSFSANRTTEELKIRLTGRISRNNNSFLLSSGKLETEQKTRNLQGLIAWSIGEQWAFGIRSSTGASSFLNQDLSFNIAPIIEYDFFPYSESTRRKLTLSYAVGASYFRYEETTIFEKDAETRANHTLRLGLDFKQTWGSSSVAVQWSNYLDNFDQNNLNLFGNLNFRIVRGLSLDVFGSYARVRDQLFLKRGGATDDEVLLRLRQLDTSYRYFASVGLRYTFGSIFNNIVNSRLDGGGDGFD